MKPEIIQELIAITDRDRVLDTLDERCTYAYDASFGTYLPDVVVFPKTAQEVAAILKLANREKIPVTPRGGGTSLSGGPLPVAGGIALVMTRMNRLLEIDRDNLIAIVEPGVITADLHKRVEEIGLFYPPDPSSSNVSTIGGNLAENAGGPHGLKYGVTKHYVIGLEVVTPQGDIIRTGGMTVKNVTGYDLTPLIIGSEGTLGVITKAILRLIPKPPARKALLAVFDDLIDSGRAISGVLTNGILPAKMEMMDNASIRAVENYKPCGMPIDADAIILLEVDGHPAAVEAEIEQAARICRMYRAREVRVAKDETEREQLWLARKLVSPAITRVKPTKISEDATVPRSKIPEMFQRLREIREKYKIHLVVFGHAGDGNLHPNIIADARDKEEMRRVEEAVGEIFRAAVELGGTLSGEHGIGTMKAPYMEMELGPVCLDLMRRIKQAWDPNNILNPYKIFPQPGQTRVVLTE
ncbi:FAD-binding oxidoreductase [Effusibacillus pohliae]|uniref:FAD-binding oxidoreductase n=1 Tax=Effusibacillus pohliae TaxID=232270 RepID=UPI000363315E|nr:FAD-linked oxidase C-terminal domain-containing protein [Effusibacillus pohliae]